MFPHFFSRLPSLECGCWQSQDRARQRDYWLGTWSIRSSSLYKSAPRKISCGLCQRYVPLTYPQAFQQRFIYASFGSKNHQFFLDCCFQNYPILQAVSQMFIHKDPKIFIWQIIYDTSSSRWCKGTEQSNPRVIFVFSWNIRCYRRERHIYLPMVIKKSPLPCPHSATRPPHLIQFCYQVNSPLIHRLPLCHSEKNIGYSSPPPLTGNDGCLGDEKYESRCV